ncbi:hypothetical protein [Kiloniella majae]|uniref:hypothetical protein n=1 Tax=Kiloniella majae TaxID=1938558 RepID=UPI000F7679FC|nr:hypothetical protein [Kiloniella majae]
MIKVFSTNQDDVIRSVVAIGSTNYEFALQKLLPLLNRFGEQRKIQSKTFYSRLKADIITGCIMPPITLAFVNEFNGSARDENAIEEFISNNIENGYILDGMQRLNTLRDASDDENFKPERPLHVNIIIAERYDLLLYRMITLNNGQKPMTARHQIEMLTKGVIDLSSFNVPVNTEKETENTKVTGAFKMSDIVEAYTAYLTDNVNNQNKKIIESKLDDIVVGRVMESDLTESGISFSEILTLIDQFSSEAEGKNWLRQVNNLIGFTVGSKRSIDILQQITPLKFAEQTQKFEEAFKTINPSKVNVGKFRRELTAYLFENIGLFLDEDVSNLESAFFELTISE